MISLYFFLKHLKTLKKVYLPLVALSFSLLFYTSYSSIPFIALSQILWLYRIDEGNKKPKLLSFFLLNGLILSLCLPWILFLLLHYKGQPLMTPFHTEDPGPLLSILYSIFHDWVPYAPLMIVSIILLILFPFFYKDRRNAILLLAVFLLPIGGLYLFCNLLKVTHFITSRYFIGFLPLFFISLYLSLHSLEIRFERMKRFLRPRFLFIMFFIASNITILPLYYKSEKQDFRGLINYLKINLQKGDKIFSADKPYIYAILHYFGFHPENHYHIIHFKRGESGEIEFEKSFIYKNEQFTIHHSKTCCVQYVSDGSRLWIIVSKETAKRFLKERAPCVLKGYFDGSFLNLNRFPTDASMYLFLWDPKSPEERGIELPIE